jgi:hypothetical protein
MEIYLNRTLSIDIMNNLQNFGAVTFKVDRSSVTNVEIRAGPGFLSDKPEVNDASDLRIKLVKFKSSPYLHKPEID